MKRLALLAGVLSLLAVAPTAWAEDYPAPDGFVVDTAGVLSAPVEASLERELSAYSLRTTNQVAVLVVRSLDGQTIEDYATALFNSWGIGQRDKDNGVLVLVAVDDRQDRIEVGTGLEDVVTEHRAQLILDNVMRPALRQEDYAAAVTRGERAVRAFLGDRSVAAAAPASGDVFGGGGTGEQDATTGDLLTNTGTDPVDQPTNSSPPNVGWLIAPGAVVLAVIAALAVFFRGGGGGFSGGGPRRGGGGFWGGYGGGGGFSSGGGFDGGSAGGSAGGGGSFGGGSSSGGGASGSW